MSAKLRRTSSRRLSHLWHHTRKRRVAAALLLIFGAANGFVYLTYRQQTYPGSTVSGQAVGSVPLQQLPETIRQLQVLPKTVTLMHGSDSQAVAISQLGMSVDASQTSHALVEARHWLPVANFIIKPSTPLFIAVEPKTYQRKILEISQTYRSEATNASLSLKNGSFLISPEKNAQTIDASGTQARIIAALSQGKSRAELMMKQTPPAITRASLQPQLEALQAKRATAVSLIYQGKDKRFTPEEVGGWFVAGTKPNEYLLSATKLREAVFGASLELSVRSDNDNAAISFLEQSINNRKSGSLALTGAPLAKKAYNYCLNTRGVAASELAALSAKAADTLNAKRGWALGGNISFREIKDPNAGQSCDFTLWLAAADQMPSFGAICDSLWSCAVRPNVILNLDRWKGASATWNQQGGSLEDYRVMVINHEVGHWLGFDHSSCPAAGQPAPVMQQQSIDLQGCSFNPWPSMTERLSLRDYLGL